MARRSLVRRAAAAVCVLSVLAMTTSAPGAVVGQDPSDVEQLFIYHLNRARSDPPAWQVEHSLPADLSAVLPQPPLALNRPNIIPAPAILYQAFIGESSHLVRPNPFFKGGFPPNGCATERV